MESLCNILLGKKLKVNSEMSDQKKTALHMAFYILFIYSFQFYCVSAVHSTVNMAHVGRSQGLQIKAAPVAPLLVNELKI